ncbi:MAG: cyclic diguanylate phosphodiesterase, partial [Deltaproteobacteria bacterium]|nr:cyclic diguanylate phosphodiesterase [Deltaproteobacteria bacterium]
MKTTKSIIHSIVGRRILGLFIACALLPICGLAFLTLRQVSVKLQEESQQRLKQTSKNIAMSILEGLSFI